MVVIWCDSCGDKLTTEAAQKRGTCAECEMDALEHDGLDDNRRERRQFFKKLGLVEYLFKVTREETAYNVVVYSDCLESATEFVWNAYPQATQVEVLEVHD